MEYTTNFMESIQIIQNLKLKHDFEGSHKRCYLLPGNKVILKDDTLIGKQTTPLDINYQEQYINALVKAGVKTPQIYEMILFDGALFQMQEKAQGNPLFILNPEQVGFCSFDFMRNTFSKKTLKFMGDKIFTYNSNMLNKLNNAPQCQYDLYVKNLCTMVKNFKLNCLDMNCTNIFYDEKDGFTFIDVDLETGPNANNMSDTNILEMAFIPFCYVTAFHAKLQKEQTELLQKRSYSVAEKLFIAAENNHLEVKTDFLQPSLSNMVGISCSNTLCNKFQHSKIIK